MGLGGAWREFGFAKGISARRSRRSYTIFRVLPTYRERRSRYIRGDEQRARQEEMTERYVFADVDLPFHVWVKEGNRWVLRSRAAEAGSDAINARGEAPRPSVSSKPAHP